MCLREAIAHLPKLLAGGRDSADPDGITRPGHRRKPLDSIKLIPLDGGSRQSLPEGVGPACWKQLDGFRDVYRQLSWDKPSVAITARCRTPSCGRYVHPEQHRGLSVREAAFLQGFPEQFVFDGPFDDKYKQIGNAVSPRMPEHIAEHLDREWFQDTFFGVSEDLLEDVAIPIRKSFSSSIASLKRRLHKTGAVSALS